MERNQMAKAGWLNGVIHVIRLLPESPKTFIRSPVVSFTDSMVPVCSLWQCTNEAMSSSRYFVGETIERGVTVKRLGV